MKLACDDVGSCISPVQLISFLLGEPKTEIFGLSEFQIFNNKTPAKHRVIFRDTLIAKKYGEGEDRTHDLLAGKAISEVHFTRWSGDKVELWKNL